MLDMVVTPPAILQSIEAETLALGFTRSCKYQTGSLLRMLAATKPGGMLLELGTGTGCGSAWLLEGMNRTARLISVEQEERYSLVAQRLLGTDRRATFLVQDAADFLRVQKPASFDLIFADTTAGKFMLLAETLALLKPGGLYVIDDLTPQEDWERDMPGHTERVEALVETLERRADLLLTRMNWSSGLIVAARPG
ncbi:putative O-methyltransferase YrrM [Thermosporothrix hazakensis]|nr:putative O-methyltransferase YrrM [Thermosporothrix hazakensis]